MSDSAPEPTALTMLYLERRADLVRFFQARTASLSEAEEVVQEIWFRLQTATHAEIENPIAYVYRVGMNVVLDRARARRRSQVRDGLYHDVNDEGSRGGPSAEEVLGGRQRVARLAALVKAMPEQRRRVFIMHKLEGLSYAEVAEKLGVSRSAVEKHMMAALRQPAELRE